jgi:hypothetical protein
MASAADLFDDVAEEEEEEEEEEGGERNEAAGEGGEGGDGEPADSSEEDEDEVRRVAAQLQPVRIAAAAATAPSCFHTRTRTRCGTVARNCWVLVDHGHSRSIPASCCPAPNHA